MMPQSPSTSAARQCLRLCHHQAPPRRRLSFSNTLGQSLSTTSRPRPYACLVASPARNCRRPSPSRCSFSAPRPTGPRQSWPCFSDRASYSTSSPLTSPESISVEEYHEAADAYIDSILVQLEQLQEERADVDCEYSVRSPSPHSAVRAPASPR